MAREEVEDPILTKEEVSSLVQILNMGIYTTDEVWLFADIIYKGFEDPYSYDEVYSDFVLSYFSKNESTKDFARESSAQIRDVRPFYGAWNGRGSDEEYHREVLVWNLDNLQMRYYGTDHQTVEYIVHRLSKKFNISIPPLQPAEDLFTFWHRINTTVFLPQQKVLMREHLDYTFLICEKKNESALISMLEKIDWNFESA